MTDVIVIGAGLNGLVAGALLAKQKLSVTILDRQDAVGGAAITTELAPGYRAPALSHSLGPVSRDVARALRLDRAGLEVLTSDIALTALSGDGRALVFHRDGVLTSASINAFSTADAGRWMDFKRTLQRVAGLVARLDHHPPPSMDDERPREWWRLLALGRHVRSLGSRHLAQLARWMPMPVSDLTAEWFESDVLRAAIAAHAVFGNPAGPRSAGTGGMLIGRMASDSMPVGSGVTARGGPGALTAAVAKIAAEHGASIVTNARVVRIVTDDGRATCVVLENGDTLHGRTIVAAVSPKHALLDLVEPMDLAPTFRQRISHIRDRGVTAKVNLALDALPPFTAFDGDVMPLSGRLLIAPDLDYIERAYDAAKYGTLPERPWLEFTIPSITDSSLAPAGGHVMSIYAHFAPRQLRGTTWTNARDTLASSVMHVLDAHAPTLSRHIVAGEILTPEDLEQRWDLWAAHLPRRVHARSVAAARPILGWAHRTPSRDCIASAGTHPGGGRRESPGLRARRLRDLKRAI
jgi:phytoene dehydrogenase-like protein